MTTSKTSAASDPMGAHMAGEMTGFADVGGHRLFYRCMGEGTPTVVLEAGLGGTTEAWAIIQPEVARFTRTCSYDRAGLGFSQRAERVPDAHVLVRELHALLEQAELPPPYILVGHSLGGILIRMYTHLYPDEVAGLVFMDSSHPEQYERMPIPSYLILLQQAMRLTPLLARVGINMTKVLIKQGGGIKDFPQEALDRMVQHGGSQHHLAAQAREYRWHKDMFAQVRMLGDLGHRPIAVVSAGSPKNKWVPAFQELHRELVQLSTRSTHRFADAGTHISLATNRDHAMMVVEAIHEVCELVRAEGASEG